MANTNTMEPAALGNMEVERFSLLQRSVLRRIHPRGLLIDLVGTIWFIYFFWYHDWKMAVSAVIFFRIVGFATTVNIDLVAFAETVWGKVALLHLNPFNLVTQVLGLIILLTGIWRHSVELTLGGISFLLFGHVVGWATVDQRLADSK